MTKKQELFREELLNRFEQNKGVIPDLDKEILDKMLDDLFEIHEDLFGATMESEEELLDAGRAMMLYAAIYNSIITIAYRADNYHDIEELSKSETMQKLLPEYIGDLLG